MNWKIIFLFTSNQTRMEDNINQIMNPETFYIYYYKDVIDVIRPFIEKQLSSIPTESYYGFHSFRQFLNKLVDPISLMNESIRITVDELQKEFIDCVWNDLGNKPFDVILSYIHHVHYQEQTPFSTLFKQLTKKYSIATIAAARCVHDCILYYIKDKYKSIVN